MLMPLRIDSQYHTQISPEYKSLLGRRRRKMASVPPDSFLTHLPQTLESSSPSKVDFINELISSVSPNYLSTTLVGLNPCNKEQRLSLPR